MGVGSVLLVCSAPSHSRYKLFSAIHSYLPVQRVWLVLEEKKVPYKWVEVNPYNKPDSLMKINPRGLVPTLEHDGKALYESSVICEFIEDAYPDHQKLLPVDAYVRAYSRLWSDFVSTRMVPAFHRYLQFLPATDLPGLEEKRQEFLDTLLTFSKAMREPKEGGFFFGGSNPMRVDLIAAPWLQRFWVLDEYKGPFFLSHKQPSGKDGTLGQSR